MPLLYERGVNALGSDLIACDQTVVDGQAKKSYAHDEYLLRRGRPLLEAQSNLESLPPRCFLIALPLKIRGGSGSPVRAVALLPKKWGRVALHPILQARTATLEPRGQTNQDRTTA